MWAAFILAKTPTLDEVFKRTSENMGSTADPKMIYAVMLGAAALVLLLVALNSRKKREAIPRAVNHQGKLLKELMRRLPIKKAEMRQLKTLAAEQNLSSPVMLILCPSLLAKGVNSKSKADKTILMRVARKMGIVKKAGKGEA